jgi:hypothetical protein
MPLLGPTTEIIELDIHYINALAPGHPVYLLVGWASDSVVIKLESKATYTDLVRNARVMGAVDPEARSYPLSASEIQELQNWASNPLAQATKESAALANTLMADLLRPGQWTKTAAVQGLIDLGGAAEAASKDGDKTDIRKIAEALNAQGGLEKLGEVLAADLFNGNTDRFDYSPHTPNGRNWNGKQLNYLVNVGNVFVAVNPRGGAPVGLDSFDPNSMFRDWSTPLAAAEANNVSGPWAGRILASGRAQERLTFATGCVEDIETVLGPRNRKIPWATKARLVPTAATRVVFGIEQGAQKIQAKLANSYRGRAKPVGLTDRAAALGWNLP